MCIRDRVTVGGANGDLYKALQTLPGTQVQGETGELLVRGGEMCIRDSLWEMENTKL